jgi:Zn-dependent protease
MDQNAIAVGFLWFLAFLFSTTVHEAMHALVAYRLGDPTGYHGGQVSLNPIPHIRREPIGMLVVPLLTALTQGWAIGWASTPYDVRWATRYPKRAALMAAAGPAGNLAIALLALILIKIGLATGGFIPPDSANFEHLVASAGGSGRSFVGELLSIFLTLNVLLCAFNLIPLPPLDGATVIGLFLPEDTAVKVRELSHNPMFQMIGLVVAWRVFPLIVGPLFGLILKAVHPGLGYS